MSPVLVVAPFDLWPADRLLLGVPFADRIRIPARRAGFERVVSFPRDPFPSDADVFVVLFPDVLISKEGWKVIACWDPEPGSFIGDPEIPGIVAVRTDRASEVEKLLRETRSPRSFFAGMKERFRLDAVSLDSKDWIRLESEADRPRLEGWLLQRLIKEQEGWMSRHVERKISLSVTRLLANTPITPNTMTLFSSGIGVAGALLFLLPGRGFALAGASLFWLHSVLDGCDGELARLKFLESRGGGVLDFWGDNVVHSAVFGAIAAGGALRSGRAFPALLLGLLAVAGTLASAGWVYAATMRGSGGSEPVFKSVVAGASSAPSAFERFTDFLARRDFIYLVLILAFFDKMEWFLWMGAVGSPIYFLILVGLHARSRRSLGLPRKDI